MDLAVLALVFGTIFVVELPDKTFIATLVLTTRYRPLLVWIGVGLAFGLSGTQATVLGMLVALSSTAVVLKTLSERGEMETRHRRSPRAGRSRARQASDMLQREGAALNTRVERRDDNVLVLAD